MGWLHEVAKSFGGESVEYPGTWDVPVTRWVTAPTPLAYKARPAVRDAVCRRQAKVQSFRSLTGSGSSYWGVA